jgi:hypothetical protein
MFCVGHPRTLFGLAPGRPHIAVASRDACSRPGPRVFLQSQTNTNLCHQKYLMNRCLLMVMRMHIGLIYGQIEVRSRLVLLLARTSNYYYVYFSWNFFMILTSLHGNRNFCCNVFHVWSVPVSSMFHYLYLQLPIASLVRNPKNQVLDSCFNPQACAMRFIIQ